MGRRGRRLSSSRCTRCSSRSGAAAGDGDRGLLSNAVDGDDAVDDANAVDGDESDAGLIEDSSDSEEDNVSITSSESCDEDCDADVDFCRVNRTAGAADEVVLIEDSSDSDDEPVTKRNRVAQADATTARIRFPPGRSRADPTVPDIGFGTEEMEVFLSFHIPRTLLFILAIMNKQVEYSNACVLDCIEFFSGQGQCTSAFLARGLRAIPYDVLNCPRYQDFNGNWGFVCALQHMRQLTPLHGLVWLGTVCSTWIFMSRNSTMRTESNARGDVGRRCVQHGNRQAARSALILAWCYSRMCGFVLEQPGSSILWRHPAMLHVQKVALALQFRFFMISTYMHHFNAGHVKRTELASNESFIHHLSRCHPGQRAAGIGAPTATTRVRRDGKSSAAARLT